MGSIFTYIIAAYLTGVVFWGITRRRQLLHGFNQRHHTKLSKLYYLKGYAEEHPEVHEDAVATRSKDKKVFRQMAFLFLYGVIANLIVGLVFYS